MRSPTTSARRSPSTRWTSGVNTTPVRTRVSPRFPPRWMRYRPTEANEEEMPMRSSYVLKLKLALGGLATIAATFAAQDARSDPPRPVTPNSNGQGFAAVYGVLPADQAEFLSTAAAIKSAAASGAPSLVWEVLEHGEKVECLDCIGAVSPLLYDSNAKTREISAWWLRRRIFGVFGPNEVYQQTINTLT